MPRVNTTISKEFLVALEAYAQKRGLKTPSAAMVELASIGYETVTGEKFDVVTQWGGRREGDKYDQYRKWLSEVTAGFNDVDPAATADGDYSYAAWLSMVMQQADRLTDGGRNDPAESDG